MGGGVSTYSVTPIRVDNPYIISNLQFNCKVNSSIYKENRPVITNMAEYAKDNIPSYATITSIPSGHLPSDINTSLAQDWSDAFFYRDPFSDGINLISLPDPFYDTSNATNMNSMLCYCTNLTTVPNFDTSNVTDMSYMFSSCRKLTTIPNFDTSKVTNMSGMFAWCPKLTSFPNFNISNVSNMYSCFAGLSKFPDNWDFSNFSNLSGLLSQYNGTQINLPNFDFANITDMSYMYSIINPDFNFLNFNTSKVTNMCGIFSDIETAPLSHIQPNKSINFPSFYNTSNVTDMSYMFSNTGYVYLPDNFNTSNVTNMSYMFSHSPMAITDSANSNWCNYIVNKINSFNFSKVKNVSGMFMGQSNLTLAPNINTSNITDTSALFFECNNLTIIPNYDVKNVIDVGGMFYGCYKIKNIPTFHFDKATNFYYDKSIDRGGIFERCNNITDLSEMCLNSAINIGEMFSYCTNIGGNIYIRSNNVQNARYMFYNCTANIKNIYCYANTTTYNTIYRAMGNNTYNSNWNAYLKTF